MKFVFILLIPLLSNHAIADTGYSVIASHKHLVVMLSITTILGLVSLYQRNTAQRLA